MVAFDNTILSLLIFPDADLRQGSEGQKVEYARERVAGLVQSVEDAREQVLVPTPALCELLVTEGADVQDILTTLRSSAYIRIESFDERAAVELAMRLRVVDLPIPASQQSLPFPEAGAAPAAPPAPLQAEVQPVATPKAQRELQP